MDLAASPSLERKTVWSSPLDPGTPRGACVHRRRPTYSSYVAAAAASKRTEHSKGTREIAILWVADWFGWDSRRKVSLPSGVCCFTGGNATLRAELACDPLCTFDEKTGTVRVVISFAIIDGDGQSIELAWSDTLPQESGKLLGGTSRSLAETKAAPVAFEIRLPLSLFLEPRRIELRLRTMKPLRSLGHGNALAEVDPGDVAGTVAFRLRAWSDLT
jgi:hypothetical protein